MPPTPSAINQDLIRCTRCARLRRYCGEIATTKKKAYQTDTYWGKPVPSFGDPKARLLIVGLAPAAHGANRTGRMFTGDRSGEWLYRALHKAGFANQPHSPDPRDGLTLQDCYITAVVHCAPPDNRPLPTEIAACKTYLDQELQAMPQLRAILCLGQIALQGAWPHIGQGTRPRFGHGQSADLPRERRLFLSYHPSQQNTFTGRLTEPMFDTVFKQIRGFLKT
ncbi:MAG: uracil-DNA glycosylase [Bacteriovoracia bacterium]